MRAIELARVKVSRRICVLLRALGDECPSDETLRQASTMELARALIAVERRARDAMIIDDRGRVVVLFAEGGAA